MPTELDYIGPTADCPHPELWRNYDAAASEVEVGDFLYGLVRLMKPQVVIETGCYLGHTAEKIGMALVENGIGNLVTCDRNPSYMEQAIHRVKFLPVQVKDQSGIQLCAEMENVDLAFLDSGGDRLAEAKRLHMSPHGVVVLHDARHKDYQAFAESTGWAEIFFPTPRGISIFKSKEYSHAPKT